MKVYHGSYTAIEHVDFSFCRKRRDFGRGFYVTGLLSQAEYWAARKGEDNDVEGVVTEFEFDESFFEDEHLNVLRFDGYCEEWLDFVVLNRLNKNERQAHDYDIIEGPVADDDIATRVYAFLQKKISKKQFLNELTHISLSHQICFCTLQSLQALELPKYEVDSKMMAIDKEIVKSLMTSYVMTEAEATNIYYTSKTYSSLADETTGLYLNPWQDIYQMLLSELTVLRENTGLA